MDAVQLAYLDVALARSVMRAHLDIEAQVAHWLLEGCARPQELAEARRRLRDAKQAHARAKAAYAALATQRFTAGTTGKGKRSAAALSRSEGGVRGGRQAA